MNAKISIICGIDYSFNSPFRMLFVDVEKFFKLQRFVMLLIEQIVDEFKKFRIAPQPAADDTFIGLYGTIHSSF